MPTEKIEIAGIGKVSFKRNRKLKRLSISVKPFEGVIVNVPWYITNKQAGAFILEKKDWILKSLEKIKSKENKQTVFDQETPFFTAQRKLHLITWDKKNTRGIIREKEIAFYYPQQFSIKNEEIQNNIRKVVERAYKMEAEDLLIPKLYHWAKHFDFSFKDVTIKNVKSKWGSCSFDDSIILSLHLMRVPEHLQDYVILHELCHTVEKNHQPPFWKLMDKVTNGNAKQLNSELKNYSTKIW